MSAAPVLNRPGAAASLMKLRLGWCIILGLAAGVGALLWFGVRPWTIAFALVMLVCPATIFWVLGYAGETFPWARAKEGSPGARSKRTGGT